MSELEFQLNIVGNGQAQIDRTKAKFMKMAGQTQGPDWREKLQQQFDTKVKAAIRSVIEDSHGSYFMRHEVDDSIVETFYRELVAPVLRKLADG